MSLKSTINLDNKVIEYEQEFRRVKNPRLEFKDRGLKVILPFGYQKSAEDLIFQHRNWVCKNVLLFEDIRRSLDDLPLNRDMPRSLFFQRVKDIAVQSAEELKLPEPEVKIRLMKARWGSCDCRKTITINARLRFLPVQYLCYVVYHEVLHFRYRSHGKRFKTCIRKKFPEHKSIDELLFAYDLLLKKEDLA